MIFGHCCHLELDAMISDGLIYSGVMSSGVILMYYDFVLYNV